MQRQEGKEDKDMAYLGRTRKNKWLTMYDKAVENTAWAGIVATCVAKNIIPFSLKESLKNAPHLFDDRRAGKRLNVDRTVNCFRDNTGMDSVHLLNISSSGMYVETDHPGLIGQEFSFDLSGRNIGPLLRVTGKVTRKTDKGMAIHFI
jgi:hypothetical protein